jgi:hypothetical protein
MKKRSKETLVKLMGALGLIVLLIGIFSPLDFWYGLLGALVLWILSGVVAHYFGVKK